MKKLLVFVLIFSFLDAKKIDIDSILKSLYQNVSHIEKKSSIISKNEQKKIQQLAKTKLPSKLFRYYVISHNNKRDFAIVLSMKVRTKKTAVLYALENGKIKSIEILAFSEPPEFKPKERWLKSFEQKSLKEPLSLGDDISINSGATLSDRAITKGARLSLAIYEVKLKK